jgi:Divergent InlB B-repeat domain
MRKAILLIVSLIFCTLLFAQLPGITWQKSLGGTAAEEAKNVIPTSDGGFIIGGTTTSNDGDVTGNHGLKDCWVVKLNAAGGMEWQKTYGGTGNETFGSIRPTSDGGFIMGATTTSNDGDVAGSHGLEEAWVVKLNSAGTIEWQKCFGSSGGDFLDFIEQTYDGGYIGVGICGNNDGDMEGQLPELGGGWIFKLTPERTIQWQRCYFSSYGIAGGTNFITIRQTSDSGFVYTGVAHAITGNAFTIKINSAGTFIGSDYVNPSSPGMYQALAPKCLAPTSDGGCVSIRTDEFSFYPVIRKYNRTLAVEWAKLIEVYGQATNISTTPDGGYIVTGSISSGNMPGGQGGNDFWLAKLNGAGTLQWQRMMGSTGSDGGNWVEVLTDSGYIVAGRASANSGDVTGHQGGADFWVTRLPYLSPSFAIISSAGANGTISPNGGLIYPSGINQVFTFTPNSNYRILNVLIDGVSDTAAINRGSYTFSNVTASHTINVTFALNTYTITATSGGNGQVTALGASTVNPGTSKTYTITPATGYAILDVLVDGVPVNPRTSYTFTNITTNHTIRALFARPDSVYTYVCPQGDSAIIMSNITGSSYRWQLNSGAPTNNQFININDGSGAYFGGTTTARLVIKNYTPDVFGYKYRCVVGESSSLINILRFKNIWTGTFDTHWEIPQNWSCGRLPDANTDVEIPAGTSLVISTNITIRSLSSGPGSNISIAPGGNLTILH